MLCAALGTTIGSAIGLQFRTAADIAEKFLGLFSPSRIKIGKLNFATCSQLVAGAKPICAAAAAAARISPDLAGGLKVKAGTMTLEVQRTYKLVTGKIAQVAINTHPAARFRHAMTMRRVKG
jgi:hypothetical protein